MSSLSLSSLQEEVLQHAAARRIQRAWKRHVNMVIFKYYKELIKHCIQRDPRTILKPVNPREMELLDGAAGVVIRFRLGGISFPPNIYYKIFTYRPIMDVCAGSPRDYTHPDLQKPVPWWSNEGSPTVQEDRSGWYQRMENNSWRLLHSKLLPTGDPKEIGSHKKMDFHFSRLQRQQDVERWRKKRKIEWLKQMYNQGRLQTHSMHQHMAVLGESAPQGVMDTTEEKGEDDTLELEMDELLAWTNTLSFDDYVEEWRHLACSQSSETRKDVHSHPPRLDPHEPAGVAD